MAERVPDILSIMSDAHAADPLCCYGSRITVMPNLNRIATGSMRFDDYFCRAGLTGYGFSPRYVVDHSTTG